MKKNLPLIVSILPILFACGNAAEERYVPCEISKDIIIDVDLGSSTDDVICMELAYGYMREGKVNVLGIVVDRMGEQNAQVADILNTYYGYPDIPIGLERNGAVGTKVFNDYATLLDTLRNDDGSPMFKRSVSDYSKLPDGYELYRKLLSNAPDGSVTILSCGFVTCIAHLLESDPDTYSDLTGLELVRRKVRELVIQGCDFVTERLLEGDYNLKQAAKWANVFLNKWPKEIPIVFNGGEVGAWLNYRIQDVIRDVDWTDFHPRKQTYLNNDRDTSQRMWDVVNILYFVEGTELFELSEYGNVEVDSNFTAKFTPSEDGNKRYIIEPDSAHLEKLLTIIRERARIH